MGHGKYIRNADKQKITQLLSVEMSKVKISKKDRRDRRIIKGCWEYIF